MGIVNTLRTWADGLRTSPPRTRGVRRFEAAAVNRLTESWMATQASIDAELRGDLDRLRRRSRDLAKNNEYMAKFLRMVRNNVIGQGMVLQSRPMDGLQMDSLAAAAVERHFAEWAKPMHCSASGRMGLWTMMRSAADSLARDGEMLIRLRPGKGLYGLHLQPLDVERLDTTHNVARTGGQNAIIMGVEVDEDHRPVAYHLLRQLPGNLRGGETRGERERVPADQILHAFLPLEPEQTRGVPWAHAAMRRLNDLGGYREAAVIAARIGASKMGFFTTPEADMVPQDGKSAEGVPYTSAQAGEFGVLPAGVGFQSFDPAYPHEQFGEFTKAALRGIASGMGVSYNSLANDLEGVNFSSIRSGVLEERDEWMVLQDWFVEQVLDPIFHRWLQVGLAAGTITQISGKGPSALPLAKREKFAQHLWMPRRWGWVDPLKDVQATVLAIQHNLSTTTDANARNGVDIEDVFATKRREKELAAQYGVDMSPPPPVAKPGKPGMQTGAAADDGGEDGQSNPDGDDQADNDASNPAARQLAQMMDLVRTAVQARQQPLEIKLVSEPPRIDLRAGDVHVHTPEQPAPVVHVAAPEVRVPDVQVHVAAPVVHVAAPEVTVEATLPPAEVTVNLPARTSSTTISRDAAGRISNTTTLEHHS
jgi:lambda family phage portal protein